MSQPLRLALAQLNLTVGDIPGNLAKVQQAVRLARDAQADLVAVPELALTGYPPEDLLLKQDFVAAAAQALQTLIHSIVGLTAVVGCLDRSKDGKLYNAAAVIRDRKLIALYRKQYLPNYGVFDEKRYFTPGDKPVSFALEGVRVGVMICEDLWEEQPARRLSRLGCRLAVTLSPSPYHAGKLAMRERLFSRRARQNHLAVAFCNLVGGQDELVFDGASLVLDSAGRRLAQGRQFQEDLVLVDLLPTHLGIRKLARTKTTKSSGRSPLPSRSVKRLDRLAEVYEALVLGLRDYVGKNGFSTVVLGLSGGIDSALTAAIAADALSPERVIGVVMPSRYSSDATQEDARTLAKALGIRCLETPIEPVFDAYRQTTERLFKQSHTEAPASDITEQNIQARIRGNLLMALSNRFGWLVLTTGNKSETATGYCTLYGDMAGGFAVIKDVPKTLVYELARYRNSRGNPPPIPQSIFDRPPTAELKANQTDQDTLPPYDVLDAVLREYVESDGGLKAVTRRGKVDASLARSVIRMVDHSEYKRRQAPPGIKITPKAFGKDRRMPITNRWQG